MLKAVALLGLPQRAQLLVLQSEFSMADLFDPLPEAPWLSSQVKAWRGIVVEAYHHRPNELFAASLPQHLITLNCGTPYSLAQRLDGQLYQQPILHGHSIVTPAGQVGDWRWFDEVDCVHLRFEPDFLNQVAMEAIDLNPARLEIQNQFAISDPTLQQFGQLLLNELQTENLGSRLYVESLTNVLAIHLIRTYGSITPTARRATGGLSPEKLKRSQEYIQDHFTQDISIDAIAAELEMSAYHFAHLFKQSTGFAPYQYQIHCRVERAKTLLIEEELSIADIALAVGFYDQSHLNRHFKRIVGVSPKAFQCESLRNSLSFAKTSYKFTKTSKTG